MISWCPLFCLPFILGDLFDGDFPGPSIRRSLTLCILSACGSLFAPICSRRKLLWQRKPLIFEYIRMSLGAISFHHSFRTVQFGFVPGLSSLRLLVTQSVSWYGFHLVYYACMQSNQIGWLLPQLHADVALMILADRTPL